MLIVALMMELCPRDQIPLKNKEDVSIDVFRLWALEENPRKEAVRRKRQVFFSFHGAQAQILLLSC